MLAFPLRDVIPSRTTPFVTILIIVLIAVAFGAQLTLSDPSHRLLIGAYGLVPAQFTLATLFTSMFLHAGWIHVLGNMLFLWIFGDTVEDRLGHGRFLALYLLCGAAAAVGQTLANPAATIPMIGASGAVAGVMGAYFVLFPQSKVLTFVFLFVFVDLVEIPAVFFLGFWFLLQVLGGAGSIGAGGGVAFWAHAAGFLAGMALVLILRRPERQRIEWVEGR